MMVGQNSELFRPLSSGGDDPFGIKVALGSYVVSATFCLVCLVAPKFKRYIFRVYMVNSGFYILMMGLISVDSSVFMAAKHGNWIPIGQLVLWLVFLVAVILVTFNRASNNDGEFGGRFTKL